MYDKTKTCLFSFSSLKITQASGVVPQERDPPTGQGTPAERKEPIRADLSAYCKRDTHAMIEVHRVLCSYANIAMP